MMDSRRKRFDPGTTPPPRLTAPDVQAVLAVAKLGAATVDHVAAELGWTYKKASNHLVRDYKGYYLDKRAVYHNQLDFTGYPHPKGGSTPDIFILTAKGRKVARECLAETEVAVTPDIDTKDWTVGHRMFVRSIRAWWQRVQRAHPHHPGIQLWVEEEAGAILTPGKYRKVVPDAFLKYGLSDRVFGLFIEADRGTESFERWVEKVEKYAPLLSQKGQGSLLYAATGLEKARVQVIAPDDNRRDWLWRVVEQVAPECGIEKERFVIAAESALKKPTLTDPVWITNGVPVAVPLVRPDYV